jgi:serine/threonine-protein kinase
VKITDFGLARIADDVAITQSGLIAGTPSYMSPEQARGQAIDPRSDLFSLGVVLYAACTGRSPFQAPTAIETIRRVCEEQPAEIRRWNAAVPAWLAGIIDRLLAKNPDERFPSARHAAEVFEQGLAALPPRPTAGNPAPSPAAESGDLTATSPLVPASTRPGESTSGEPSIAVLPFQNLSADPENESFSDGLAEDLINALTRVERARPFQLLASEIFTP